MDSNLREGWSYEFTEVARRFIWLSGGTILLLNIFLALLNPWWLILGVLLSIAFALSFLWPQYYKVGMRVLAVAAGLLFILGLIMAPRMPGNTSMLERSSKESLKSIQLALEMYSEENEGTYPRSVAELEGTKYLELLPENEFEKHSRYRTNSTRETREDAAKYLDVYTGEGLSEVEYNKAIRMHQIPAECLSLAGNFKYLPVIEEVDGEERVSSYELVLYGPRPCSKYSYSLPEYELLRLSNIENQGQ